MELRAKPTSHTVTEASLTNDNQLTTTTVDTLANVSLETRDEMLHAEKTTAVHRHYMQLPCMNTIELGGHGTANHLADTFRVIAWNIERGMDIDGSAILLKPFDADIILLSEVDNGMARTQQKNVAAELAVQLGMYYCYGIEFLELGLGSDNEIAVASDDFNQKGFHGNAILSKMPIASAAMLRLNDHGYWFTGEDIENNAGEPRIGGRMALFASFDVENGQQVTAISTHFESHINGEVSYRDQQIRQIISAAEAFTGNQQPIIIGGDLNTGNRLGEGLNHTNETLFATAEQQGFHWGANISGVTTRPSVNSPHHTRREKLDWFCAKHINSHHAEIIPALDEEGMPMSDHDPILSDWSMAD